LKLGIGAKVGGLHKDIQRVKDVLRFEIASIPKNGRNARDLQQGKVSNGQTFLVGRALTLLLGYHFALESLLHHVLTFGVKFLEARGRKRLIEILDIFLNLDIAKLNAERFHQILILLY